MNLRIYFIRRNLKLLDLCFDSSNVCPDLMHYGELSLDIIQYFPKLVVVLFRATNVRVGIVYCGRVLENTVVTLFGVEERARSARRKVSILLKL